MPKIGKIFKRDIPSYCVSTDVNEEYFCWDGGCSPAPSQCVDCVEGLLVGNEMASILFDGQRKHKQRLVAFQAAGNEACIKNA